MAQAGGFVSNRVGAVRRVLGVGLMFFSAVGLVISVLGLIVVFALSGQVASNADHALEITVDTLTSTQQNLDLTDRALGEARVALSTTETFVEEAGSGLENTSALMGSLSEILGSDLPYVIEDTQDSLAAAEEGAAVIEDVLRGLNAISGLTGLSYDPEVSLTDSFAGMNESLGTIPATLAELDDSLEGAQQNLDELQTALSQVATPLTESEVVLAEAQASVQAYSSTIEQLAEAVGDLRTVLPAWIRTAVLALCFLLVWLAVSQIGLLWQGWEMVSSQPRLMEARLQELEEKLAGQSRRAR
jgi:ABC-type transporter Mla subunit MlaD